MSTNVLSAKQIKRNIHTIDAKGKVLGRLAGEIANLLTGKGKINYVPYLDNGDFVTVINSKDIKITGKKAQQKNYFSHSGYPHGLKTESFEKLLVRRPNEIIHHAVLGMVPRTKLGKSMIKRLKIYPGEAK